MPIMATIMNSIFLRLEKIFAYLQGKGFGADTVEREVALALQLLGTAPRLVLDVGANQGHWTHFLLKRHPNTEVHAFEPQPVCAQTLRGRFGPCPNVSVHQLAVSDAAATLSLYFDFAGSGLASLSKRELDHFGIDFTQSIEVKAVALDDYLATSGMGQIDIIKIDVEGHEMAVFKGMKEVLASATPPKVIQFEFGGCNIDTRTYFRDFFQLLSKQYEIYRLTPFGPDLIDRYREIDECFRTTNFFLKLKC